MPSAEITAYTAHTGRLGQLGTEQFIVLRHRGHADDGGTQEASSEIYFADRFGTNESGFTTMGTAENVRAHLPAADYAAWLDLLRNEDPVFLHWSEAEHPGEPDPDGILHLATGPEPPGEGPIDLSP